MALTLRRYLLRLELPHGVNGIVLTGPYMDPKVRQRLCRHTEKNHRFRVLDFVQEPTSLLRNADCVVAMGGYNTICEILSFGKPAMIVPRVVPRKEQLILAKRLKDLGVIDMLHPDQLEPKMLTDWLKRNVGHPPQDFHNRIKMNGLTSIIELLKDLLTRENYTISSSYGHQGNRFLAAGSPASLR